MIDPISISINLTLPLKSETHITQVDGPLVDEKVSLIPSSVDLTLPLKSEVNTTYVLLITSNYTTQGGISSIST